jgi:phospholipid/cholesterol/gamma-HCH transport system substrate-binding protein
LKGFSKELRVGLLLAAALVLMGGFLFELGGISLESRYAVFVDFNDPGSLKAGSPVRIAGVDVGMVQSIQYLGRKPDPQTGRQPLVRVEVNLNEDVQDSVHEDARFYVTSAGILGESFLGLEPGSDAAPVLKEGGIIVGVDPPRLDQALTMGYELLETVVDGVRSNREEIGELVDNAAGMLKSAKTSIGDNGDKLDTLISKVETMSADGTTWLKDVRTNYVEGPKVKRIVNTVDTAMQDAVPLVTDIRSAVNDNFGAQQRAKIKTSIDDVASFADRSKVNLEDAQKALVEMQRGEGTAGKLLMDQDLYDDFQEILKDLKHNPWKLFWRE